MEEKRREKTGGRKSLKFSKRLKIQDKCQLIDEYESGQSKSVIAKRYSVSITAVTKIINNKEKLKSASQQEQMNKRCRVDEGQHPMMEAALLEWIKQKRSMGIPLSGPLMREKALWFNEELINLEKARGHQNNSDTETGEEDGNEQSKRPIKKFIASDGWLSKFKARHGMRQVDLTGEKLSADMQGVNDARNDIRQFLLNNGYDFDNVYNAEETVLYPKSLPPKTLAFLDEKTVSGFKVNEERVTIMICANATGSHKIPLLLIGKSARPGCFAKNKEQLPLHYAHQSNSWMNGEIFTEWYANIFIKSVKSRKPGKEENFFLLLDNAPCHPSTEELNKIDPQFKVHYLPPNLSSVVQPMDQGVIECMKKNYKKIFLRKMFFQDFNQETNAMVQFIKNWNVIDTIFAVASAWSNVPSSSLREAWKNLMGGVVLAVEEVDSTSSDLCTMLNIISNSYVHSMSDIEQWIDDDGCIDTCGNVTDHDIAKNVFAGNAQIPLCEVIENEFDTSLKMEVMEEQRVEPSSENLQMEIVNAQEAYHAFIKYRRWYEENLSLSENDVESLNKTQECIETKYYELHMKCLNLKV